jgi:HEAT repeat protein
MRINRVLVQVLFMGAAISLSAEEPMNALQLQIRRLGKDYADVYQREAQAALLQHGAAALPLLIESLEDSDYSRRIRVIELLGDLRDRRAISHLLRVFERSQNTLLRCKIMEALGKMRDSALFVFITTHLQSADPNLHCFAIWALGEQRSRKAVPYLVQILTSERGPAVPTAIDALGKSGTADQAPLLLEFLKYENTQTRYVAAKAVGQIGDARIAPAIFQTMLQEPDVEVQEALARAYGKIGGEEGIAKLVDVIRKETSPTVQRAAGIALQSAGLQASFHLMPLLKGEDLKSKIEAAKILGAMRAPGAIRPLIEMMEDDNPTVRMVAIAALGECGDISTIRPLTKMARSRHAPLRSAAADALKKIASRNEELYQQERRKS